MGSKKSKNGIFFEATDAQKRKIKKNAALCGMRQGEYILRRALGYEPKAVQPDAFCHFHKDLCDLLNKELSPETEAAALKLFDEIYAELIDDRKQPPNEIIREVTSCLPPDYGLSSAD